MDGYLTASYGDFDPMIIEAIKALNKKVDKLQDENAELRKLLMEFIQKKSVSTEQEFTKDRK